MIEHSHLKIIQALDQKGTLTEAANALCLSQSALSHQIRYLEKKLSVALWQREGRGLRLTQAGELLLQTAQQVLPVLSQAEKVIKAYGEGRQGVLRIGVECYPCYAWLTRVVGDFLRQMPDVEIEIVNKFQFSGLEGLVNHHIDILVTPDLVNKDNILYEPLASYQMVLVIAKQHRLAIEELVTPELLSREILLSFPVPRERLDILTQFLSPAARQPAKHKEIESIDLMLQLVSLQRGVCVLPQWLAEEYCYRLELTYLPIGLHGMTKKLFLAIRETEQTIAYIEKFIYIGGKVARQSFHHS